MRNRDTSVECSERRREHCGGVALNDDRIWSLNMKNAVDSIKKSRHQLRKPLVGPHHLDRVIGPDPKLLQCTIKQFLVLPR